MEIELKGRRKRREKEKKEKKIVKEKGYRGERER
jgi:hypothetical protein